MSTLVDEEVMSRGSFSRLSSDGMEDASVQQDDDEQMSEDEDVDDTEEDDDVLEEDESIESIEEADEDDEDQDESKEVVVLPVIGKVPREYHVEDDSLGLDSSDEYSDTSDNNSSNNSNNNNNNTKKIEHFPSMSDTSNATTGYESYTLPHRVIQTVEYTDNTLHNLIKEPSFYSALVSPMECPGCTGEALSRVASKPEDPQHSDTSTMIFNALSVVLTQQLCTCNKLSSHTCHSYEEDQPVTCPIYSALYCLYTLASGHADAVLQFQKLHSAILSIPSLAIHPSSLTGASNVYISIASIWSVLANVYYTDPELFTSSPFTVMSHNLLHEDVQVRIQATTVFYTLQCEDIKMQHASIPLNQIIGIISCLLDDMNSSIRATSTLALCLLASYFNMLYSNNHNTNNHAITHLQNIPTPMQETMYNLLQAFKRAGSSRNALTVVSKVISLVEGVKSKKSMSWFDLGIPLPRIACNDEAYKDEGLLSVELPCFCYHTGHLIHPSSPKRRASHHVPSNNVHNTQQLRSKSAMQQTRALTNLEIEDLQQTKENMLDTSIVPADDKEQADDSMPTQSTVRARQARSAVFTRPIPDKPVSRVGSSRRFSKQHEMEQTYGISKTNSDSSIMSITSTPNAQIAKELLIHANSNTSDTMSTASTNSSKPMLTSPVASQSALRNRAMQKRMSLTQISPQNSAEKDVEAQDEKEENLEHNKKKDLMNHIDDEELRENEKQTVITPPIRDEAVSIPPQQQQQRTNVNSRITHGRRSITPQNSTNNTNNQESTLQNNNSIYINSNQLEPCYNPAEVLHSLLPEGKGSVQAQLHDDWQIRFNSLLELRKLSAHHAAVQIPHTRAVIRHQCAESESQRSALSKHALMCVYDFIQNTPMQQFTSQNTLSVVLPSLLSMLQKKSTESSEFISSSALIALQSLVERLSTFPDSHVQVKLLNQLIGVYRSGANKVSVRTKGAVMEQIALVIKHMEQEQTLVNFFDLNINALSSTMGLGSTLKERATPLGVYGPLLSLIIAGTSGETPMIRQNAKDTLKILESALGSGFLNVCMQHCDADTVKTMKKVLQLSTSDRKPSLYSMQSVPTPTSDMSSRPPDYNRANTLLHSRGSVSKQGSRLNPIGKIENKHIRRVTPTPPPQPPVQPVPVRPRQRPTSMHRDKITDKQPTSNGISNNSNANNHQLSALSIQPARVPVPTSSVNQQPPLAGRGANKQIVDSRHY